MRLVGDDQISIDAESAAEANSLATRLRANGNWRDVVPGLDSVVVQFDNATMNLDEVVRQLEVQERELDITDNVDEPLIEIPMHYGGDVGPDFEWVCQQLSITPHEFVRLHTGRDYVVDMIGFTPGFAYVGGLDTRLNVPRLAQPRTRVAAGSVGIAAGQTGLYALPGPGGWPLIGRTALPLFDAEAKEPFTLRAGSRVRFSALPA